ncbi:homoserine dehydrogenase [Allohahella marinimesophila]|uniref:Homoserine dehydrogenase n=1 Tax=Allohahella marinimesophila TaxID=1054972 RepID=A0ABP7Q498_9GAMM
MQSNPSSTGSESPKAPFVSSFRKDDPLRIGLCGLGTVGKAVINVLQRNADLIAHRAGRPLSIINCASRRYYETDGLDPDIFSGDVLASADRDDVDVIVELIGGTTTAYELVRRAITNGKHVVTANKALLAEHGNELFDLAREHGVVIAFEAAVAGGIPIIKALREGLAGNRIDAIAGIINGTGNFILTEMQREGSDFFDVLAEAQARGYAEADPTFDVEGIDAAHKLALMASIAFGMPLAFERTYTEGISRLTPFDIQHAAQLGYIVKHLGIARRHEGGVELRVHPALVPDWHLLARIDGVLNAVVVHADAVGQTLYCGAGAGGEATASAVIADLVDLARHDGTSTPMLGTLLSKLTDQHCLDINDVESAFYIRLFARDEPGVLASVATILSNEGINIESIMQKESDEQNGLIPIVLLTHRVQESRMNKALASMADLDQIIGEPVRIRVADLLLDHRN